jgi:hypothetical protein
LLYHDVSAADRKQLAGAAKQALLLREDAPDRITVVIGAQAWPFPIPIVERNARWQFDTAAGIEELLNRIVGKHELAAIDLARHYVVAQAQYASEDRDGDAREESGAAENYGNYPLLREAVRLSA